MIGMLWLDTDPKASLEQKINKATAYYKVKCYCAAETVLVNAKDAEGIQLAQLSKACGVTIRTERYVLPRHFIVGVNDMLAMEKHK